MQRTANGAYHIPIMLEEVMDGLNLHDGGIYLDGTLGGGGHSEEILRRTAPNGRLIAIDRDTEAIAFNERLTALYGDRVTLVHGEHENAGEILDKLGIVAIDGAMLDLGLSSHQIDEKARGFSYSADAALDMRMDATQELTAETVVNEYSEKALAEILYKYGEEPFSRKIAAEIVARRKIARIETTKQLSDITACCIPKKVQFQVGHPAKKTFQAIRIEVNHELTGLSKALEELVARLKIGGRLCVITFHSLEDRIAKQTFRLLATDCICDKSSPVCVCGHLATLKLVTRKPTIASEAELRINSRAGSAKLRIVERIR